MHTVFSGEDKSGSGQDADAAEKSEPFYSRFIHSKNQAITCSLIGLCLITVAAYWPVLFNFFVGDDFVHLTWLKDAVKNPELILRNFHSSWLDGTTTKFYRPLISVFMVSDYLISGTNGIAFHITNLVFLLSSSIIFFFVVKDLQEKTAGLTGIWFPLAAAGLFALYPLHPEAVSWITGRVDAIVTTFVLASLWCYMRWRSNKGHFGWPILFMTLGLMSKEMAITLPATFLLYEIVVLPDWRTLPSAIIQIVKPTIPFWLLLAGYFALRYWALGTFVGGYDDSLTFISNWHDFIGGWLHGLRMTFVPVNKSLIGDHSVATIAWQVVVTIMFVIALINCFYNRSLVRCAIFFVVWTGFCLAPVYKIFAIADDLQGSRLAYLATVPICAGLALAFAGNGPKWRYYPLLRKLLFAVVAILAFGLLLLNNQPWARAGRESNAIRAGLSSLYSTVAGDPQMMLVGLPDQIDGAYVCRNAITGMTQSPQFPRTIQNCLMVNKFEPILPFGYLKESIAKNRDSIKIERWNQLSQKFDDVTIPKASELNTSAQLWRGEDLQKIVYGEGGTKLVTTPGGVILQNDNPRARPTVSIKPGNVPCFNSDFVQLTFATSEGKAKIRHPGADLVFTNDLLPETDSHNRVHSDFQIADKPQTVLFPLRSLPEWCLGGTTHAYRILLPEGTTSTLTSVELIAAQRIMPLIGSEYSYYLGSKGFLHLGKDKQKCQVTYDALGVPGANSIVFEITRPNLLFAEQNTKEKSSVIMTELKSDSARGSITLDRKNFPSLGLYEGRSWAIDKNGTRIGVSGDHIVIAVDS